MDPKFTLRWSKPDPRDFIYSKVVSMDISQLPARVMLPDRSSTDIQIIGDCTGESGRTAYGVYLQGKMDVSPDFFYAQEKLIDGQPNVEGSQLRYLMQVMTKTGGCERHLFPQILSNSNIPLASQDALNNAANWKISQYARIQTLDEIKHAIASGNPVIIGVYCLSNFVNCEQGFIDTPEGNILGGHAITVVGYDDNLEHTFANTHSRKGFLKIKNSWGSDWGDQGYGWICYDFLTAYLDPMGYAFQEGWTITPAFPIVKPKKVVTMIAGENGSVVTPDGITLVPLRMVAESLGCQVDYDQSTRQITITEFE